MIPWRLGPDWGGFRRKYRYVTYRDAISAGILSSRSTDDSTDPERPKPLSLSLPSSFFLPTAVSRLPFGRPLLSLLRSFFSPHPLFTFLVSRSFRSSSLSVDQNKPQSNLNFDNAFPLPPQLVAHYTLAFHPRIYWLVPARFRIACV